MAFIIIGAILALVGGIGLIVGLSAKAGKDVEKWSDADTNGGARAGGYVTFGLCLLGFLILFVVCSTHLVAQREVGIVKNFSGQVTGSVGNGVAFTAPWSSIQKENIGLLRENFVLDQNNSAVSSDQQPIYADLTLNYRLDAKGIVNLYKTVGPNWKSILIDSRVLQDFKEVTSTFTAQQITTHREDLRQATKKRLISELAKYDITVDDFFVTNLDYTDTYKQAINAKNIQVQQALQAEAKVAQARAEAQQHVASANGDAQANVAVARGQATATIVKAQADAKALNVKGRAIRNNPEILKLEAIDKLNPNAKVVICTGTGQDNCPSFLGNVGN